MKRHSDYLNDVLIRLAHHSSAIEGNTLTLPETVSIILESTLPGSHKSIREFYEVENHKQAFNYILDALNEKEVLTVSFVKKAHALLTDRLQHDAGQFKTQQNAIIGADFMTASPMETPLLMQNWCDNTAFRLKSSTSETDTLHTLAETHIQFERIHPFSDGNGRTGRLILLYLSMVYLNTPIIVTKEKRAQYMELLAGQDSTGLTTLFTESLTFEKTRIQSFH